MVVSVFTSLRIASLILRLPVWGLMLIGLAMIASALLLLDTRNKEIVRFANVLKHPPPRLINLIDFDPASDVSLAGDVWVSAYLVTPEPRELEIKGSADYAYVALSDKPNGAASLIVSTVRLAGRRLEEFLKENKAPDMRIEVRGTIETTHLREAQIMDDLSRVGLSKANNILFLKPFLDGRSDGLSSKHVTSLFWFYAFAGVGSFFTMFAALKRLLRSKPVSTGAQRPKVTRLKQSRIAKTRPADKFENGPILSKKKSWLGRWEN